MTVQRHKVFISYYHKDDQEFKKALIDANERYNLFEDCSVHEDEIEDDGMTAEQIRRKIRDDYMQEATVLILLCGQNTKRRKHIDWEIHTAMYDSEANPKMGILVINLPSINQSMIACGSNEEQIMGSQIRWTTLKKDKSYLQSEYSYLPNRIITNIARVDVSISIVNWEVIANDANKLIELVDNAFKRCKTNNYDHSEPLRRNNSNS